METKIQQIAWPEIEHINPSLRNDNLNGWNDQEDRENQLSVERYGIEIDEIPATIPQDRSELTASNKYQLVVLGRGEGKGRESVLIRLPQSLLGRLGELANGSRSTLVELALHHMLRDLTEARSRGEPVLMIDAKELQDKLEKDLEESMAASFSIDESNANNSQEVGNHIGSHRGSENWKQKSKKIDGAERIIRAPHLRRRFQDPNRGGIDL